MKKTRIYSLSILSMVMILLTHSIAISEIYRGNNKITEAHHNLIAKEIVKHMTLEEKIKQMFIIDASSHSKNSPVGGVILFQNSLRDVKQILKLTHEIQESSKTPLFIGIDQEGGGINRLSMGTTMPGNMALGATNSTAYAFETGKLIGKELKALGINVNFAPVLDVNNNPSNPVIGIRSFGSDPELVARLGVSYINGLRHSKVISAGKHFPGHGDTTVDSHIGLPQISHNIERLWDVELKPFQRAVNRGVDMIMTAHVTFPTIDDTTFISKKNGQPITIPATLSHKVLTGLLREEMGFNGIIVTDAFNMKAIADHFSNEEAIVMAIKAGADMILMPTNMERAYNRVMNEVRLVNISEERIDESVVRIIALKSKNGIINYHKKGAHDSLESKIEKAKEIVGGIEHKKQEEEIAENSTTVIINENILPFKLTGGENILLITPSYHSRDHLQKAMLDLASRNNMEINIDHIIYSGNTQLSTVQKSRIEKADYIILGTHNLQSNSSQKNRINYLNQIIQFTNNKQIPLVVISLGNPYDIMYLEDARAYVAIYGDFIGNINSGIKTIFGEHSPKGRLPVEIPNKESSSILFEFGHGVHYP